MKDKHETPFTRFATVRFEDGQEGMVKQVKYGSAEDGRPYAVVYASGHEAGAGRVEVVKQCPLSYKAEAKGQLEDLVRTTDEQLHANASAEKVADGSYDPQENERLKAVFHGAKQELEDLPHGTVVKTYD